MVKDKDFEQNETPAEEQLQIADPEAPETGAPTGGDDDPSAEDQNPGGEADEQENEPLPRTWN